MIFFKFALLKILVSSHDGVVSAKKMVLKKFWHWYFSKFWPCHTVGVPVDASIANCCNQNSWLFSKMIFQIGGDFKFSPDGTTTTLRRMMMRAGRWIFLHLLFIYYWEVDLFLYLLFIIYLLLGGGWAGQHRLWGHLEPALWRRHEHKLCLCLNGGQFYWRIIVSYKLWQDSGRQKICSESLKTSQELRMLSRSLSDCQSTI